MRLRMTINSIFGPKWWYDWSLMTLHIFSPHKLSWGNQFLLKMYSRQSQAMHGKVMQTQGASDIGADSLGDCNGVMTCAWSASQTDWSCLPNPSDSHWWQLLLFGRVERWCETPCCLPAIIGSYERIRVRLSLNFRHFAMATRYCY